MGTERSRLAGGLERLRGSTARVVVGRLEWLRPAMPAMPATDSAAETAN